MQTLDEQQTSTTVPSPRPEPDSWNALWLSSRYQGAWNEHCTRITQRQTVLQLYLGTVGFIYGLWFDGKIPSNVGDKYVPFFITFIAFGASALMCIHNRVITHLTEFLTKCENCSEAVIASCGSGGSLFYFRDKTGPKLKSFHSWQRFYTLLVLFGLIFITDLGSIVKDWVSGTWKWYGAASLSCLAACIFSGILLPFLVWWRSREE
jgi:hypothetical protein